MDVSRETLEDLQRFQGVLLKWNARINLISRRSEDDLWSRHIEDSAQLWTLRPQNARVWADLGAGAGFPGLILAILGKRSEPDLGFILVESDARKCAFLHTVTTDFGLNARIVNRRIETLDPLNASVISARALAPLETLLNWSEKHLQPGGICLFPKGETVHKEIEAARETWRFTCIQHQSQTSPTSAILEIGAIERD